MPYDDGAFTMFLYTKGRQGVTSVELQQFLTYFEDTTKKNACNDDLEELHKMVSQVRVDEEVELAYMKIFEREEMIREQGRTEGDTIRLLQQIKKKMAKRKSLESIAEELEEDVTLISILYELIENNPDKTAEEILQIKLETEQQGSFRL